jgi:hypothetical protein
LDERALIDLKTTPRIVISVKVSRKTDYALRALFTLMQQLEITKVGLATDAAGSNR